MAQTNLVTRVRWEIARAFEFSEPVILAVSGGADSLCLADAALAEWRDVAHKPRFIIAHLNHHIRGPAAAADAEFVRAFATQHHATYEIGDADVPALAQQMNVSIEVAARMSRYDFLARMADKHSARYVATAHHADDQAETVLLRLIRGTGLHGLRGMQVRSPMTGAPHLTLLRPLLRLTRGEIEQYCADRGLQPRHDATNDDPSHTRNRIRHELLPLLGQFNPGIRAVLARLADTAATDVEIIEHATQQAMRLLTRTTGSSTTIDGDAGAGNEMRFDRAAWLALPIGLRRATLREAARRVAGHLTDLKYSAIEEACDVLSSATSGEIALTGELRIRLSAAQFVVSRLP